MRLVLSRAIEIVKLISEGLLSNAKLPDVQGIEKFRGSMLHSARWRYDITGGSPKEPVLTGLEGKIVGIVGKSSRFQYFHSKHGRYNLQNLAACEVSHSSRSMLDDSELMGSKFEICGMC